MPSPGLSGLGGPCPPPLSLCSSSPGPCPGAAVCWACSQPRALPPATRRDCALGACPPPWALEPRARAAPGAAHGAPCAQGPCTQQGWALPHSSRRCLQGFVPALGFLIKPRARRVPVPLLLLPVPGTPSAPPFTSVQSCSPQTGLWVCVPQPRGTATVTPRPPSAPALAFLQLLPRRLPRPRSVLRRSPPCAAPLCDSGETQHGGGGRRVPRQGTVDVFCLSVPSGPGSD